MKKLNTEEIKQFANALSFTESEAKDITDLFYKLKIENPINHWKVLMPLNDVDEYIREWENHWHREMNWQEFYNYEKECCYYDYDEPETIFTTIETFKEYVKMFDFAYELKCSDMIIIVC